MTVKDVVNKIPVHALRAFVVLLLSIFGVAATSTWDAAKTWKAKVDATIGQMPATVEAIHELRTDMRSYAHDQLSFQRDIYLWNGELQKAKAAETKMNDKETGK